MDHFDGGPVMTERSDKIDNDVKPSEASDKDKPTQQSHSKDSDTGPRWTSTSPVDERNLPTVTQPCDDKPDRLIRGDSVTERSKDDGIEPPFILIFIFIPTLYLLFFNLK